MKPLRTLSILAIVIVLSFATMGAAYGSESRQTGDHRQGLFGTVTAVVDNNIVLDSGAIVGTDSGTRFLVPGVDDADLSEIIPGERVAIVATEVEDGSLLALDVLLIPVDVVDYTHLLGVVTEIEGGLVTLIDDDGHTFVVELPSDIEVNVGDYFTIVTDPNYEDGELKVKDASTIEDVLERFNEDIEHAVGRAQERLRELLEDNGDEHITALLRALDNASEKAQDALHHALDMTYKELHEDYDDAGLEGPFARVKGFITALEIDEDTGLGSVTVKSRDGSEIDLAITEMTKLEDPLEVGDYVRAKYNLDLEAVKVELRTDKVEFEGTVANYSDSELYLVDGSEFVVNGDTEIRGILSEGVEVEVNARPMDGSYVALRIKVEDEYEDENGHRRGHRNGGQAWDQPRQIEIKGTITDLSDTEIKVDGLSVLVTPDTEIKGNPMLDLEVKIHAVIQDGILVAEEIKVKIDEPEKLEFYGTITDLSNTSIEVDGLSVLVTPDTEIQGNLTVGAKVKVEAVIQDGSLLALEIRVKSDHAEEIEIEGKITYLSEDSFEVDEFGPILITPDTDVEGVLMLDAYVEVELVTLNGVLTAVEVEVEDEGDYFGDHDEDYVDPDENQDDLGPNSSGHSAQEPETKFKGTVASFSDTELVLADGTSFVIGDETEIEGTLLVDLKVRVEATASEEGLVAVEIDVYEEESANEGHQDGNRDNHETDAEASSESRTLIRPRSLLM